MNKNNKNKKIQIWVLNGPNINLLGLREPNVYGTKCYIDYLNEIKDYAKEHNIKVKEYQTNSEGELVDLVQYAYLKGVDGIVINPGAYTHYSYALHDALAAVNIDTVEVHISDIDKREDFRKVSVTKAACDHQIYGQGLNGYLQAMDYCLGKIRA